MTPDALPIEMCQHCREPVAVRNPSGFCDHLHYPDSCDVCSGKAPRVIIGIDDRPTEPADGKIQLCPHARIHPSMLGYARCLTCWPYTEEDIRANQLKSLRLRELQDQIDELEAEIDTIRYSPIHQNPTL